MKEQVVLVDFENVQKLDLARLPAHARIKIFVGAQQAKVPAALACRGHRVDGNSPNALDFHTAPWEYPCFPSRSFATDAI